MALLRSAAAGTPQADDLMAKLRERFMLSSLVAQSGFSLAAWLADCQKYDSNRMSTDSLLHDENLRNSILTDIQNMVFDEKQKPNTYVFISPFLMSF